MMRMGDYLLEVEYATTNLLAIIWKERERLRSLETDVASLTKRAEYNYRRAEFVSANAEDHDDVAMATGLYWDNYFGDDKERYYKNKDREKLIEEIAAHAFSVGSIAGSLLQYAKQGVSLCHRGLVACPNGRGFGSQFLKDIIWQSRNQTMHWEEGRLSSQVRQCFETLAKEINVSFEDYQKRNMAIDVIDLLGWTDFAKFRDDMLLLA
jgi:hypothetical protein